MSRGKLSGSEDEAIPAVVTIVDRGLGVASPPLGAPFVMHNQKVRSHNKSGFNLKTTKTEVHVLPVEKVVLVHPVNPFPQLRVESDAGTRYPITPRRVASVTRPQRPHAAGMQIDLASGEVWSPVGRLDLRANQSTPICLGGPPQFEHDAPGDYRIRIDHNKGSAPKAPCMCDALVDATTEARVGRHRHEVPGPRLGQLAYHATFCIRVKVVHHHDVDSLHGIRFPGMEVAKILC